MQISAPLVGLCSLVATAATVANAYLINQQFYPTVVYITKSNASMAVIYFQAIMVVFMLFQVLKRVFFGELRAAETEHLSERAWHAVLETCLAFTVFRDDFSPVFVMQFVALLFVKCFHWLADDRVDVMERSPLITMKFHARMLAVIGCLAAVDSYLVSHAYFSIMLKGASSQLVFGFEYAILMVMVFHVAVKYILHMHDLRTAQAWEAKAVYLLYAELVMNFCRCLLYGLFALLMVRLHTFPLFSIRPFYLSVRALHKALNDVILSRRAIAAMNTMFPVVSTAELTNMDATCIICREEMTADSHPKRLPCSHVFHAHCLRSWFQRQQTCPTCRTDILGRGPNREQPAPAAPVPPPAQGQPPFVPFVAHQFAFHAAPQMEPVQRPGEPDRNAAPAAVPGNFFIPPFPAPFMHPMGLLPPIPPPMPRMPDPPALDALSDDELRAMEGDNREAILNRLRRLQDVSTLLDAVDILMLQYNQAIGNRGTVPSVPPTNQSTPAAQQGEQRSDDMDENNRGDGNERASHTPVNGGGGDHASHVDETPDFSANPGASGSAVFQVPNSHKDELPNGHSTAESTVMQDEPIDVEYSGNSTSVITPSTSRESSSDMEAQELLRQRRVRRFDTPSSDGRE